MKRAGCSKNALNSLAQCAHFFSDRLFRRGCGRKFSVLCRQRLNKSGQKSHSVLRYQPQPVQLLAVLRAAGDQIDAGGFNRTVPQHVGQLCNILARPVKRRGKQVPQIVGEHLGWLHASRRTQPLHLRPDLAAGQPFSAFGEKDLAGSDFLFLGVFQQPAAQLVRQENGADLAFEGDLRTSGSGSFYSQIFYLADPDAGGADGLHQQRQPALALCLGSVDQPLIFRAGQFPGRVPKQPALDFQKFDAAVPPQKAEQTVEGGQRPVDGHRRAALGQ